MVSSETSFTRSGADSRFGAVIRSELFAMQFQSQLRTQQPVSSLFGVQAGLVDVLRYSGVGEQWGGRDETLIRSDHADYYVVCAPTSARLSVNQNGCTAELHQGSFTLVSTSLPFRASIQPESDSDVFSAIHIRIPGAVIRRHIPNIDGICGLAIPVMPGCSRLMLSLCELALTEVPHLPGEAKATFGRELLEIINSVANTLVEGDENRIEKVSSKARVVNSAKTFISSRLADPDLDPGQIADHCGVSTRFLHASFREMSNLTVAQVIRENRLRACQAALTDSALRRRTVIQIAGDWGFDDPAHFCRLYKARFGRTPREERTSGERSVK